MGAVPERAAASTTVSLNLGVAVDPGLIVLCPPPTHIKTPKPFRTQSLNSLG